MWPWPNRSWASHDRRGSTTVLSRSGSLANRASYLRGTLQAWRPLNDELWTEFTAMTPDERKAAITSIEEPFALRDILLDRLAFSRIDLFLEVDRLIDLLEVELDDAAARMACRSPAPNR